MSEPRPTFSDWIDRMSLSKRVLLLGLTVALLFSVVGPIAWFLSGKPGLTAAAVAAGICLLSATLALIVSYALRRPAVALYGLLFGMALRMGIPLVFAGAVHLYGGGLAKAGVLYYLLVFYPLTLGIETVLSLPKVEPWKPPQSTSQDVL